jgi:CubicO group peptidase (beta-lactamase class C family)
MASNDSLPTGSLNDAHIKASLIQSMDSNILNNNYPNIHSVLIWKNKKLVFEKYYSGKDQIWGDDIGTINFHKDSLHDVRSITKSIVSACVGLAIAQGKIKSVDQRVFEFYPEYTHLDTGLKSTLTIKHLLTMTTGQAWNEDLPYSDSANSEIRMVRSTDPVAYALSQPIEKIPGTEWRYNGGSTQILASIIQKTTGKRVDEFAAQYLFEPLGITRFTWTKYPGTDLPAAASGLRLRSRDLMKFGLLYLNNGKFNENEILPASWVEETTRMHITQPSAGSGKSGYGYQFWLRTLPSPNEKSVVTIAIGNGNQRIFIDKVNDLVIVVTAGNYNNWSIKNNSDKLVEDFIYPALKSD